MEKELRKKLVKYFVWSVAFYGTEIWTLRRSEQKRLEAFQTRTLRRMEHAKWTDKKCSCSRKSRRRKNNAGTDKEEETNWLGHWLRRYCLLEDALEGMVKGRMFATEDIR